MDLNVFRGDLSGLTFPADYESLTTYGADFLTRAFRKTGILTNAERVSCIDALMPFEGGSTGRKAVLWVSYESKNASLAKKLFVKFSRDFDDSARDLTRVQMASEIYMAQLSAVSDFPVLIPRCFFADYHAETGSGILITEQVLFGESGIEPLMPKSVDHLYANPASYYRLVLDKLGTLAGAHSAGKFPAVVKEWFPYAPEKLLVNVRKPPSVAELDAKLDHLERFIGDFGALLPKTLTAPELIPSLREGVPRVVASESLIFRELSADPSYIALCHWNAQLDNAWFWRNADNALQCGLMDWGNAGQLNVAMAIWGCLCGAQAGLWDDIDDYVDVFVTAFHRAGGASLSRARVLAHLDLYIAHMGVRYMLDVPAYISSRLPADCQPADYLDPHIQTDERMRSQLAIFTNFLGRWLRRDYASMMREFTLTQY